MNFKKTASLIAVSLIFLMSGAGLLPTPACLPAANRPVRVVYADGDCTFSMSGDEIIGYDGNASSVVIPDYVRKIGTGVFSGHTELRSVAIPDSVEEIGLSAFSGCTGLSGVTLPDSVIYIHDWAFAECTGLSYMKIPDSVTGISGCVFQGCTNLTSVHLGKSVTSISSEAFVGCTSLSNINIPEGVTEIGISAFSGCSALTAVTLPDSLEYLDAFAFHNCTRLTGLNFPDSLKSVENGICCGCTGLRSVNLGNSIDSIPCETFYGCTGLTEVTLPESVKIIDNSAFYGCTGLKKVNMNHSVTVIGENAFEGCARLTGFTIPDSVTGIHDCAFSGCDGLTGITIPNSVTYIGEGVFAGCANLSSATVAQSVISSGKWAFSDCEGLRSVILDSTVRTIPKEFFIGCERLESITMPDSVTKIDDGAFSGCTGLKSIRMPNGVTTVSRSVFSGCSGLTEVTLPDNATEIYPEAFMGCTGLKNLTIPDGVTFIAERAFSGCSGLTKLTLPDSVSDIGEGAFSGCSGLTSLTFGNSVSTIQKAAFENCTGLTAVTLPESVIMIGEGAFSGCTGLKEVTLSGVFLWISDNAFGGCAGISDLYYAGTREQWNEYQYDTASMGLGNNVTVRFKPSDVPLKITSQPTNAEIALGDSLTLSLRAEGEGLQYQWYFKKAGQTSFSLWKNRTHSSETVTPNATWNGIQLYCVVKDSAGNEVTSDTVRITVSNKLKITSQPTNAEIALGGSLTLSLRAEGDGLQYQWYFKKAGQTSFSVWKNRTHSSETVTPSATWNGIQLYCVVRDSAGNEVTSDTVRITVSNKLKITSQPTNAEIALGGSLTLSLRAEGDGLQYQWYFKKAGQTSFSVWKNRTHSSETVTPNSTWNGIQLYCVVRDSAGNEVTSDTVKITVSNKLKITSQPTNAEIALGGSLTLSLRAEGEGLQYQWYFKKAGQTSFSLWKNRTHSSETVTPNATWNGIQLYCVVRDSAGNEVTSDTVRITVSNKLKITSQPTNAEIALGGSLTLSLRAEGVGLQYQWYFKKAGQTSFSLWKNRTHSSESVTPNATWNGIQLYCVVKDSAGNEVTSDTVTVTIA